MKSLNAFLLEHNIPLFEGGNIVVTDINKNKVSADPISISPENRASVVSGVRSMADDLHDHFNREAGGHLFGRSKVALDTGSAYSGSTQHLMNRNISDKDFAEVKPTTGDVDLKIPAEHFDKLHSHLVPGRKFGPYTVVGSKKSGGEIHAIMRHDNGQNHQIDFEKSTYEHDEPSKFDVLAHGSDWNDTRVGIKGFHHKNLLNSSGVDHHKFSILYGLKSRADESEPWESDPKKITSTLFGPDADHTKLGSFHGLTELIRDHIPPEQHQLIYSKFKSDIAKSKGINHEPALAHLRDNLNVKDDPVKPVAEAVYSGNIGFMEMMKYLDPTQTKLSPQEKARFHAHLAAGRNKTAKGMLERKLKIKFM